MKRTSEKRLLEWYQSQRRKPLIIRGARQVGKSTLVRQFASSQKLQLVEINLEKHPRLNEIFKTNDTSKIRLELEGLTSQALTKGSLLFLDEIQAAPSALPALRYLFEDMPELPVIAAGSLLEFTLAEHGFSMPVGRIEYLHLGPMTFEEFLLALGDEPLLDLMQRYRLGDPFPSTAHERLLERQRQYLFVGGMPESVLAYSESKNLIEPRKVQLSILQTYEDDFAKYSKPGKERALIHKVLSTIPKITGKKNKYAAISREERSGDVKIAIDLLIKARLLLPAYHSDASGIPLQASEDNNVFKLYFLDVGLFNQLCGMEWNELSRLPERELINEGVIAEQFAAQHLAYWKGNWDPPHLNYWLRESRSQNAEIDFLATLGTEILPIEIKSGKSGSLKSLQHFALNKKIRRVLRFDLNPPSRQIVTHQLTGPSHAGQSVSFELVSLPISMIERAGEIMGKTAS